MRVILEDVPGLDENGFPKPLNEVVVDYETMDDHAYDYSFEKENVAFLTTGKEVVFVVGIKKPEEAKKAILKSVSDFLETDAGKPYREAHWTKRFDLYTAFDVIPYEIWTQNGIKIIHIETAASLNTEEDLRESTE